MRPALAAILVAAACSTPTAGGGAGDSSAVDTGAVVADGPALYDADDALVSALQAALYAPSYSQRLEQSSGEHADSPIAWEAHDPTAPDEPLAQGAWYRLEVLDGSEVVVSLYDGAGWSYGAWEPDAAGEWRLQAAGKIPSCVECHATCRDGLCGVLRLAD